MAAAVGHELFTNDQLAFTAKITTYRIHRDNITEQQHQVATANHDRRQRASAAFRAQYHDWEVLRQTLLDTNALVDQAVTAGTLSDEQAKTIKAENQRTYQDQEPHRELAPRLAIPQHRDYQLVELQAFRVTKSRRPHRGWQRTAYDPKRWSDRRYTRFLAARSMPINAACILTPSKSVAGSLLPAVTNRTHPKGSLPPFWMRPICVTVSANFR